MTKNVKVSNISIKIGKNKITLTLDEAKELKELLNETFGDKETVYIPQPYPIYERPWRWEYWDVYYTPLQHWTYDNTSDNVNWSSSGSSITYTLNSAEEK